MRGLEPAALKTLVGRSSGASAAAFKAAAASASAQRAARLAAVREAARAKAAAKTAAATAAHRAFSEAESQASARAEARAKTDKLRAEVEMKRAAVTSPPSPSGESSGGEGWFKLFHANSLSLPASPPWSRSSLHRSRNTREISSEQADSSTSEGLCLDDASPSLPMTPMRPHQPAP